MEEHLFMFLTPSCLSGVVGVEAVNTAKMTVNVWEKLKGRFAIICEC